jgi:hypothetical protein
MTSTELEDSAAKILEVAIQEIAKSARELP